MSKVIRIHQWVGLGIILVSLASLASVSWSIIQNAFFYKCPVVPPGIPEAERVLITCSSLTERIGWQIPGLFIGLAMLTFGLWTYIKGKDGVPVLSIGRTECAKAT